MRYPHISIVSRSLPPLVIGTPIILHNLFSYYKGDLSAVGGWQRDAKKDHSLNLNFKQLSYFHFGEGIIQRIAERFQFYLFPIIRYWVKLKLKKQSPDAIFAVFPNEVFFVSAYLAAKELNIPFVAHIHDLWSENTNTTQKKEFAEKWEEEIISNADLLAATTEAQLKLYKNKYGKDGFLLPHTIKDDSITNDGEYVRDSTENIVITYTGNINRILNLDAIQIMIQALDYLPDNYTIRLFTSMTEEQLKENNLYHKKCEFGWVSKDEIGERLLDSDLLYLPLSFKESNRKEIETVFATKTLDYLVAKRPILVHSPEYAHHNQLAIKNEWGFISSEQNPKILAKQIISAIENEGVRKRVVSKMITETQRRSSRKNIDRFTNTLNSILDAEK